MKRSVSLAQVAAKSGVSVMTASRALSGVGYTAESTKAKVLAAAKELGYTQSTIASVMKGKRTNVIGIIVQDLMSPVVNAFVSALASEIRAGEMDVFIYNAIGQFDAPTQRRHDELLHGVWDGLIYVMPRLTEEYLDALEKSDAPVVLINFFRRPTSLPVVLGDNFNGSRDAVANLIALGHQRIAFIRGTHWTGQSGEREKGYRQAMADAGIDVDERWVVDAIFSDESGIDAATRLLNLDPRPTAIFAANDETAIGCLQAARTLGLEVPEDLSLVGFDDHPAAKLVQPRLTTIRQPAAEMAKAAVQELLRRINEQPGWRQRIEFPSELVIRESTACAPDAPPLRKPRRAR